ncbi:MOSC domain-containing protein [Gracilibacillus sp. S3-1-1]|uniref:MOSC domain-containing protein n=1 Tax=Gracilibacillus pellucidus TaxID=3095368 RepID=A0ACC6M7M1_9BACI|nr:MOSC domain-containing protein [Gracilibacillus sp. S3-1-1]MDX8046891.1 MOSC domain-containing protein [Gracilibacillus sp. S3-1-1]
MIAYQIVSLNVGKPQVYSIEGKELETGFIKKPVDHANYLTFTGFEHDGQADRKNHGGPEKALLMYAKEHYSFWQKKYDQTFDYPAFGENITIAGLTEEALYIGDVFTLGEAEIQVSQPRRPCYKIARVHGIPDMPAIVTETGFSGYYFRVLKEGWVKPSDTLVKTKEAPDKVTPKDIFYCLYHDRINKDKMEEYSQINALAPNVKESLIKRIKKIG